MHKTTGLSKLTAAVVIVSTRFPVAHMMVFFGVGRTVENMQSTPRNKLSSQREDELGFAIGVNVAIDPCFLPGSSRASYLFHFGFCFGAARVQFEAAFEILVEGSIEDKSSNEQASNLPRRAPSSLSQCIRAIPRRKYAFTKFGSTRVA
ncbi:hypothetical protein GYMLUDRAFT_33338 [Collybiopsis luxurians FD-317 M1]|nr:hypothetical protein GYMLUDRAFT_33338 [Collybiopsis luxurians FD-317 M1]